MHDKERNDWKHLVRSAQNNLRTSGHQDNQEVLNKPFLWKRARRTLNYLPSKYFAFLWDFYRTEKDFFGFWNVPWRRFVGKNNETRIPERSTGSYLFSTNNFSDKLHALKVINPQMPEDRKHFTEKFRLEWNSNQNNRHRECLSDTF